MRLVDADRFKRFLQALCKAGAPYYDVIQLLDKEPTAYDVEKVVAYDKEIRAKAIDDLFDYLKTQRKGIYMRVDFDDLEIRQYKEKLKAGEIDE